MNGENGRFRRVEIKIEGYSLNSQDLQKIASFTSVTEEKGLTYDEIESQVKSSQRPSMQSTRPYSQNIRIFKSKLNAVLKLE